VHDLVDHYGGRRTPNHGRRQERPAEPGELSPLIRDLLVRYTDSDGERVWDPEVYPRYALIDLDLEAAYVRRSMCGKSRVGSLPRIRAKPWPRVRSYPCRCSLRQLSQKTRSRWGDRLAAELAGAALSGEGGLRNASRRPYRRSNGCMQRRTLDPGGGLARNRGRVAPVGTLCQRVRGATPSCLQIPSHHESGESSTRTAASIPVIDLSR